ncbi:MAG: GNAT family N-acetyltransferase [Dehalococcoidia bacterium]
MEHVGELTLRNTTSHELAAIAVMEQGEAAATILPASAEQHREDFVRPDVLYESLVRDHELLGFVILVLDPDGLSLEMRRIVVAAPGHGNGTRAVRLVDDVARAHGRERIWLDVFEENARARHVYENCGYSVFGDTELNGRRLLLYERFLEP